MKSFLFYFLFLITLISFASGFVLCLANINDMNDVEFAVGIFSIGFGIFTIFVLWKNNFLLETNNRICLNLKLLNKKIEIQQLNNFNGK